MDVDPKPDQAKAEAKQLELPWVRRQAEGWPGSGRASDARGA